jgi:hypothetical protein
MVSEQDPWLQLSELSNMFGISEESIKRLAKNRAFPLRRITPYARPGVLQSELFAWLKAQPRRGLAVRTKRAARVKTKQRHCKRGR